jgi:hypothetical protein
MNIRITHPVLKSFFLPNIPMFIKLSNLQFQLTVSTFGCIPSVWFILADVSEPPKVETVNTEHSESLKSRITISIFAHFFDPFKPVS